MCSGFTENILWIGLAGACLPLSCSLSTTSRLLHAAAQTLRAVSLGQPLSTWVLCVSTEVLLGLHCGSLLHRLQRDLFPSFFSQLGGHSFVSHTGGETPHQSKDLKVSQKLHQLGCGHSSGLRWPSWNQLEAAQGSPGLSSQRLHHRGYSGASSWAPTGTATLTCC